MDDPANAKIWRERCLDRKAYEQTFSRKALISKSLPRSADFRQVLSRLNDNFLHPNPDFAYRALTIQNRGPSGALEVQFFDLSPEVHEAHLLAYLNLLDLILQSSKSLVETLYGPALEQQQPRLILPDSEGLRAAKLAARCPLAKTVMEDLGLWRFRPLSAKVRR